MGGANRTWLLGILRDGLWREYVPAPIGAAGGVVCNICHDTGFDVGISIGKKYGR